MDFEIEEIDSLTSLENLEPEWQHLWRQCPTATPFQSPEWLIPWLRHLWGGGKLWVLALRRERRLAGIAPFFLWGYGQKPEVIHLSLVGSGVSDYLDILIEPGSARAGATAILNRLAQSRHSWRECDLQELRPSSALLHCAIPETITFDEMPCGICPVVSLPASYDELDAQLASKFRTDLRRAANRLAAAGDVRVTRATEADLDQHLDSLFRLHRLRWEDRSEAGVLATERLQQFHRKCAARMLRAGMLRLYGLHLKGDCIAVQYNFAARRRAYAYLSGFDPAHGKYSPGMLLLEHAIRDAIAEGCREFDFLRKRESFKYEWGARDQQNRRMLVTRAELAREVA